MAIGTPVAGTLASNSVAGTTLAVPYPASISAGDILVLCVDASNATAPTNPAGFTSQVTGTSGGSSPAFRISTKIATGSESGSLNVTTPSTTSQGQMFAVPGVDGTTPIDVAGTTFGSGSSVTAYNIPTLTTTTTGVMLLYMGCSNSATGSFTPPTSPAAFTEATDNASPIPRFTVGYLIWSSSGATGTVNLVATSARGAAGMIALRPAATSVTGTVAVTEGGDTSAVAALEVFTGTAAPTEGGDTSTASGIAQVTGTVAVTAGADTSSATGSFGSTVTGTVAATEGGDTSAVTALEVFAGTAAPTQGADTSSVTALEVFAGTAAVTAGADTSAVTALEVFVGTASPTAGADTSTATGTAGGATVTGSAAVTQADDTASAIGTIATVNWFRPPTVKRLAGARRLYNLYTLDKGVSVVKVDGHYRRYPILPSELMEDLVRGVDYFRGGTEAVPVSDAVAAQLTADGFTVYDHNPD